MKKIPKLRFKEFYIEWDKIYLKNIATKVTAKNIDGRINTVLTNSAEKGIIKQEDFFDKEITNEKNINIYYLVEKDSFVYNPRISNLAPYGPINRNYLECGIVSPLYLVFNIKKENRNFIEKYFKTSYWFKYMYSIGNSGARSDRINISNNDFFNMELFIPKISEQEKIAEFLSAVDVRIDLTNQKLELLKNYKKGIMQKIFSQGLRFKDENGNDYPDWEEKELKELLELIIDNRGKTPPNSENKSLIPLLEVNSIGERKINYKKVIKFVTEETYNTWFRGHIIRNDILFSTVGATALCSVYKNEKKSVIAQNLVGLRIKKNYVPDYIYSLITETKNNLKFKSIEMIAVQPSIKVSQMINLKFKISISYEEQKKIADFLSSIDNKIEKLSSKLEELKEFKKGLLQQMFV